MRPAAVAVVALTLPGTGGAAEPPRSVPEMCTNLANLSVEMEYSRPLDEWPAGVPKLSHRSLVNPENADVYGSDMARIAAHLHQMTDTSKRQAREYLFRYCLSDFGYVGPVEAVAPDDQSDAAHEDDLWRMRYEPAGKCLDPVDWETLVECGNEYMKKRQEEKNSR